MAKIKRALISVSNKEGIIKFAKGLKKSGIEIISTGGTAKALKRSGISVIDIAEVTGYPVMLSGRIKSIHPVIEGGILADRGNKQHMKDLEKFGIKPIDMVVCNLYPFEKVISKLRFAHEEAIENIDIGGPTMVRAAAKNYKDVVIIVDPADYDFVMKELKSKKGKLSLETKERLSLKAFEYTERYDSIISLYLRERAKKEIGLPQHIDLFLEKMQDLRYGENPHQKGALYKSQNSKVKRQNYIIGAKQLHGKELSFNNILDLDSAWALVNYFADPTVAIIKHTNPCGVGQGKSIDIAYKKAYETDPASAYGGVIGANRAVNSQMAKALEGIFIECIIAPRYDLKALKILKKKKNLRILELAQGKSTSRSHGLDYKRISGGFLVQEPDTVELTMSDIKIVSKKHPTLHEIRDLFFAWGVCKYVKSNAIVIARDGQTLGIGAGQVSRVESVEIALKKAKERAYGAVLASDGFFPFRDSIDIAGASHISAIIQPGGSIRDKEVIEAAKEYGLSMVITGRRHFRH